MTANDVRREIYRDRVVNGRCVECGSPNPGWHFGQCPLAAAPTAAEPAAAPLVGAQQESVDRRIALARGRKAARIARVLRRHRSTAAQALALPESGWVAVAALAGVPLPSPETQATVVGILEAGEDRCALCGEDGVDDRWRCQPVHRGCADQHDYDAASDHQAGS
jgi:hypothetical protein